MTGTETGLVGVLVSVVSLGAGLIWGNNGKMTKVDCEKKHEEQKDNMNMQLDLTIRPIKESLERIENKLNSIGFIST